MSYQEHQEIPAFEKAIWEGGKVMNAEGSLKWSGTFEPPAIGTEIIVTINSCGPAVVTGYFSQDGWLGLMCKLHSPPEWHVKQNKGNPNGHVFGVEFKLPEVV